MRRLGSDEVRDVIHGARWLLRRQPTEPPDARATPVAGFCPRCEPNGPGCGAAAALVVGNGRVGRVAPSGCTLACCRLHQGPRGRLDSSQNASPKA